MREVYDGNVPVAELVGPSGRVVKTSAWLLKGLEFESGSAPESLPLGSCVRDVSSCAEQPERYRGGLPLHKLHRELQSMLCYAHTTA